ncbi:MAG TPA: OsmC family protein, partial [Candidatus Limnocylindrales bacterium]
MSRLRQATLVHNGGNRFTATTGTHRVIVMGDKVETGSLSPVETLVVCLAACTAMDVTGILAKKRQDVASYSIEVEGEQRDEYPQILTRIVVTHVVEGPAVEEAAVRRSIELSALKYCPVNAMLSAGATEVHHRYVARRTGEEPFEAEGEVVVTGPFK